MVLSGSEDNDLALSEDFILKTIFWLLVQGLLVRGGLIWHQPWPSDYNCYLLDSWRGGCCLLVCLLPWLDAA